MTIHASSATTDSGHLFTLDPARAYPVIDHADHVYLWDVDGNQYLDAVAGLGRHVGAHLGLLANFFPGYRVTFFGSLIGFFYMFIVGLIVGVVLGAVYNKIAKA